MISVATRRSRRLRSTIVVVAACTRCQSLLRRDKRDTSVTSTTIVDHVHQCAQRAGRETKIKRRQQASASSVFRAATNWREPSSTSTTT